MSVIFFDLDNTLAKFSENREHERFIVAEKMWEKGFFRNLQPFPNIRFVIEELQKDHEVYILSACIDSPHVHKEKIEWVHEYLPSIADSEIILIPCNQSKADHAKKFLGESHLNPRHWLVDDYELNLDDWASNGGSTVKRIRHAKDFTRSYEYCIADLLDLLNLSFA